MLIVFNGELKRIYAFLRDLAIVLYETDVPQGEGTAMPVGDNSRE